MDTLGKLFQSLLDDATDEASAQTSEETVTPEAEEAVEAFSAADTPQFDLGSLLGGLSGGDAPRSDKLQLLCALKPYLRDGRRRKLDRIESLLSTAYTVRSLLSSLGGILNV